MLDLGVWMALQSKVETIHCDKVMQSNQLSKSIHQAFAEITPDILTKIHEHLKLVLHLIELGKGTIKVVEEHRGKLNKSLLDSEDFSTIPETVKVDGY